MKVEQGYKVTLFQHGGFNGIQAEFGSGDHDMNALTSSGISNDSVSSLIVAKLVCLFKLLFSFQGYLVSRICAMLASV